MADTLKEEGYRYVRRANGRYDWVHPAELRDDDHDCTDMSDDEFEAFVLRFPPPPQGQ